jgi:hypothetical protein
MAAKTIIIIKYLSIFIYKRNNMGKEMRKLIDDFNTFNNKKLNESDKYIPDHDNILQIMRDKYGYGDLSYGWMEEFEQTKDSLVTSDEEYAEKFNKFIEEN